MSGAPNDELDNCKGDGDWFKIAYYGPQNDSLWAYGEESTMWNKYINFTIPETTLPGHYLVRVEQFMTLDQDYSQWFINCAQIKVEGKGGGNAWSFRQVSRDLQENRSWNQYAQELVE